MRSGSLVAGGGVSRPAPRADPGVHDSGAGLLTRVSDAEDLDHADSSPGCAGKRPGRVGAEADVAVVEVRADRGLPTPDLPRCRTAGLEGRAGRGYPRPPN